MKKGILIITLFICHLMGFSQIKTKCATDQELTEQKQKLLKESNFKELISLQAEINLRIEYSRKIDSLKKLLPDLISAEKFLEAADVKEKMNNMHLLNRQRIINCEEYNKALINEDYLKANQYKNLILKPQSSPKNSIKIQKENAVKTPPKVAENNKINIPQKNGIIWNQNKAKKEDLKKGMILNKNKKTENEYAKSRGLKSEKNKWYYGINVGYNWATQNTYLGTVNSGGTDKAKGYLLGFYLTKREYEKWGVRVGIDYTSIKNNNTIHGAKVAFLKFPSLFEYYHKDRSTFYIGTESNVSLSELGANTRRFSSAFKFGCTYKWNSRLFTESSYERGITNMVDYKDYKAHIHFLMFKVGFRLN